MHAIRNDKKCFPSILSNDENIKALFDRRFISLTQDGLINNLKIEPLARKDW